MPESDPHRAVRLPDEKLKEIVRTLEARARRGDARQRSAARHSYIASDVRLTVIHPGGGEVTFIVCTRNLSAGGLSFLHGGFLHRGTEIHASLPALSGSRIAVSGRVVMCRHLQGPVHEVGVEFYEKINPSHFVSADSIASAVCDQPGGATGLTGDALCISATDVEARLLEHQLRTAGLRTRSVAHAGTASDVLAREPFDLVVADFDSSGGPGIVPMVRSRGHRLPVLVVTFDTTCAPPPDGSWGLVDVLIKPYTAPALTARAGQLLLHADASAAARPIHSELDDAPGSAQLIDAFIQHARTTALHIRAMLDAHDRDKARAQCLGVRSTAAGYGFPQIGAAAGDLLACLEGGSDQNPYPALARLESLVARLRTRRPAA